MDNNVLDRKPIPPKGAPACYYERNGWVDQELADLHKVAITSLDPDYDPSNGSSVYRASGRYYRAAVLSVIFRGLDTSVAPSHHHIAELLNAAGIPKRREGAGWTKHSVRRLLCRCGVLEDFLAYRNPANGLFAQWFEGPDSKVVWCSAPSTIREDQ